jgi:preprotein translocase subunit SecA
VGETIAVMRQDVINETIAMYIPEGSVEEQWDVPSLEKALQGELNLNLPLQRMLESNPDLHEETIRESVQTAAQEAYSAKEQMAGAETMRQFERAVMLQSLDNHWREHLASLDHLRQGIHLRSYAQKNPKQEYKREAFELFANLLDTVKREVSQLTMQVQVRSREDVDAVEPTGVENVQYQHTDYDKALGQAPQGEDGFEAQGIKVGRNDPCPCGSGQKYKACHGKLS